jgi:hypothetical protein
MKNAKSTPFLLLAFGYLPQILLVLLIGLVALFIWELQSYAVLINEYIADENERFAKALGKPIFLEILALVLILSGGYFAFKENKTAKTFATVSALVITIVNIVFVYQMFRHYETLVHTPLILPETEMYLIVTAVFAVGEFLSYYVVSEYRKQSNVLIDTTKEIDLNQLWNFIELFGMPQKPPGQTGSFNIGTPSNDTQILQATGSMSGHHTQSIGFQIQNKDNKPIRGKSIDYAKMQELIDKGLGSAEISRVLKCSESSVRKFKQSID